LKRRAILRQWIHVIGRKNLSINKHTCVCSVHFIRANGRILQPNEVPSLFLPSRKYGNVSLAKTSNPPKVRASMKNYDVPEATSSTNDSGVETSFFVDSSTQTEVSHIDYLAMENRLKEIKKEIICKDQLLLKQKFSLENIKDDDAQVCCFTGFQSFKAL
jgi:hypothetical protein